MKRNSIFILVLAAIFIAAAGMRPVPQDNPPVKMKNTHIKVVTIKDGEKQVLDTIIEGKDLKVMHMGKGENFTWTSVHAGSQVDTLNEEFEVMKGGGKGNKIMIRRGGMVHAQMAPGMRMPYVRAPQVRNLQGRNVIDLSDPGIISFEKKKLSGGREKITIIRNEVKQNEQETFNIRVDESVNEKVVGTDLRNAEKEIKVKEKSLGHSIDIEKK